MAIWFVRTDGSDSTAGVANGRDALGLSISNATYDHTGGTVERMLTSTGAFGSVSVGERIYLLNAAGGVAAGLYTIEAVDGSGNYIGLEADSGLTADSTADVDSSDGAFATLSYAIDEGAGGNGSFANGDTVTICNNATHSYSNTVSFDTVGGIVGTPIIITGATATGVVDGTRATLDFSGTVGSEDGIEQNAGLAAASVAVFQHLRITGAARHGVTMLEPNSIWFFYNCRIDSHGSDGVSNNVTGGGTMHYHTMYLCEIDSNGGSGFGNNNANRIGPNLVACSIHDNTGAGVEVGQGDGLRMINGSVIYGNGGNGIQVERTAQTGQDGNLVIVNTTINRNGGNGLDVVINGGIASPISIVNSVISDNSGYGIDLNTESSNLLHIFNTYLYNNTSGDFSDSYTSASFPLADNVTTGTNPSFTSTTDGSEDYEPTSSSPLIGAGILGNAGGGGTGYMDIGALQREMASGGGGLLIHPGMTGGMNG